MFYNETDGFKLNQSYGEEMMQKWEKALNADGGIADQHKAMTTAILLENYMNYLQRDQQLIMEDQVESNAFQGVNLALLGLLRRIVPAFVGGDLVGTQAMPTPRSPIFYLWWKKSTKGNQYSPNTKGGTTNGDELFGYPASQSGPLGLADPYFSSSRVKNDVMSGTFTASQNPAGTFVIKWRPVVNSSVYVSARSTTGVELARIYFPGAYNGGTVAGVVVNIPNAVANFFDAANSSYNSGTFTITIATGAYTLAPGVTLGDVDANWEYTQEANKDKPEMLLEMKEDTVTLIRRELRGKMTLDSLTDSKAYWGINLENEMNEILKLELMNEINREIIEDLRTMAAIYNEVDYNVLSAGNVTTNYDDIHKVILDTIDVLCAEILNQGRLGKGNFVVGNPSTLAFLDRVPGFVGSGVKYDQKTLSYYGTLGNRISFYIDPQYRKNELLIGYKGPSAIDSGYIYAPYLPITPTPTLYDTETGDARKIFYTRYGKTFEQFDPSNNGLSKNKIYRGEYQYARLVLRNFPALI